MLKMDVVAVYLQNFSLPGPTGSLTSKVDGVAGIELNRRLMSCTQQLFESPPRRLRCVLLYR